MLWRRSVWLSLGLASPTLASRYSGRTSAFAVTDWLEAPIVSIGVGPARQEHSASTEAKSRQYGFHQPATPGFHPFLSASPNKLEPASKASQRRCCGPRYSSSPRAVLQISSIAVPASKEGMMRSV